MKKSLNETGAQGRVLPVTGAGLAVNNPSAEEGVLPAIRGVQARREYHVVLMKLREFPRLFTPIDPKMPPELRAQRTLSKVRVSKIASYIVGNLDDYNFSSLVGAVDRLPRFEPAGAKSRLGTLFIPARCRSLSSTVTIVAQRSSTPSARATRRRRGASGLGQGA